MEAFIPADNNSAQLFESALAYAGAVIFVLLSMVARSGTERRLSTTASRPWLRFQQVITISLALRCAWLFMTAEKVLTDGTSSKCLTGFSCSGAIFVTTLNRLSMLMFFAGFAIAAEQMLRIGRPPPPLSAAKTGELNAPQQGAIDDTPTRLHHSSARRDKCIARCDLMYLLLSVWLLVVQLVILAVSLFKTLEYTEANQIYDAYIIQVAVLNVLVSFTLYASCFYIWRHVSATIVQHRLAVQRIVGGDWEEDADVEASALHAVTGKPLRTLLSLASGGKPSAKSLRAAEERARALAFRPQQQPDGSVLTFAQMGDVVAQGGGYSALLLAPVPADEEAFQAALAATVEEEYLDKMVAVGGAAGLGVSSGAATAGRGRGGGGDIWHSRQQSYARSSSKLLSRFASSSNDTSEDVARPLLSAAYTQGGSTYYATATSPTSPTSPRVLARSNSATATYPNTPRPGIELSVAQAQTGALSPRVGVFSTGTATSATRAAVPSARLHELHNDLDPFAEARVKRHKEVISLLWHTRLRIVAVCFLSASLFIIRSVMFLWRPVGKTNINGEAGEVMYPWWFYTIPEIVPSLLFGWLVAGFSCSCRRCNCLPFLTCLFASPVRAPVPNPELPDVASAAAILSFADGSAEAIATGGFMQSLSQFLTADQEQLFRTHDNRKTQPSLVAAVAQFRRLSPAHQAQVVDILSGTQDLVPLD